MTTSEPDQGSDGAAPVEPTITGVFMQDYTVGGPVTDSQRRGRNAEHLQPCLLQPGGASGEH
jgi:hypothetical protein